MIAIAGGTEIPRVDYATFGTAALAANAVEGLADRKAVLFANHGVIAAGANLK
jgi:L-fuculose-phosphate aldolase